ISVGAASIKKPVQDSAVASISRLPRHAASTASAKSRSAASGKKAPSQEKQDGECRDGIKRGENVVGHDAKPATHLTVGPAHRPRLEDVEQAEQQETQRIARRIERRHR